MKPSSSRNNYSQRSSSITTSHKIIIGTVITVICIFVLLVFSHSEIHSADDNINSIKNKRQDNTISHVEEENDAVAPSININNNKKHYHQQQPENPIIKVTHGHHHHKQQQHRLLIFDTSIGRFSNQLLTITAAMALASMLGRVAVLPPLFFGGGKGGGGNRVVPLTELYDFSENFEKVLEGDHEGYLYCNRQLDDDDKINNQQNQQNSRMCFILESELGTISANGGGKNHKFWKQYYETLTTSSSSLSSSPPTLGCLKMKGVSNQPRRRSTRPSDLLNCQAMTGVRHGIIYSKKKLDDVMSAATGDKLKNAKILFVPLTMYVSDVLEPLVIEAWKAFSKPVQNVFDGILSRCRRELFLLPQLSQTEAKNEDKKEQDEEEQQENTKITVGIHLRALEGSCRDRIKQVLREAPMLTGHHPQGLKTEDVVPADASSNLETHCKMTSRKVVEIVKREVFGDVEHKLENNKIAILAKSGILVYVADDGQQDENERKKFLNDIQEGLSNLFKMKNDHFSIQVKSLSSTCHQNNILFSSAASNDVPSKRWISSYRSDPVARGTVELLTDFWTLVNSDIFIGNQLSTVSVNICRTRLARGKECQNFVRSNSAAVGKLMWTMDAIREKYKISKM